MPTIALSQVRKTYPGSSTDAVRSLDLEIADGEFMCLLGPSGCGKTTTLRMIAGLENLSAGELRIGDRVVDSAVESTFVPPEDRKLGLVFQSYALWPHLTIERNTDFGLRLRKVPKAERIKRTDDVMRALGIEQYRDRYPSQLSGGQQQRVALARMLAVSPGVLLLDEPLSNLDARLRLEMRAELKRIHGKFGTTIVFVTHDQWEAMTLATTIAVMNDGVIQQMGTPDDIYERPANRFVAEFVGSPPINLIEQNAKTPIAAAIDSYLDGRLHDVGAVALTGIRPEAIVLHTDAKDVPQDSFNLRAEIEGVLPTGGSWIVEVRAGGQLLFMTTHVAPTLSAGDDVTMVVEPAAFHLFDTDGQRMLNADKALGRSA
ncbi:carbohydrate ABC transporter ATP-binding protein (CUT1 family) [Litoreibacter meonggei]|uniref:Carbohydrate ABC transporter ATP-binding protein (CUT1 family) n=1 Tax=Litoreibacter meonggei TaxID=1049199 RepID=A0A497WNH3_9RHOB|nr:ABC transporter ATP-binding protein [Litoreibacter meonggei]RLJ51499.1 carbohydrate ABC transporter ATP-binding protein (CUT1 family) [Litoreibacter meonggei]